MATPEGAIIPAELDVEEEQQPSLTYGIDFERGRIVMVFHLNHLRFLLF